MTFNNLPVTKDVIQYIFSLLQNQEGWHLGGGRGSKFFYPENVQLLT